MKNLCISLTFACVFLGLPFSCKKDNNNYELADYTLGLLKTRTWHGRTNGYIKTFKIVSGDTIDWAEPFSRTFDTTFAPVKVNAFVVDAIKARLKFFSIDSATTIKVFDSTYANSDRSYLLHNWGWDTAYFEYHKVEDYNPDAGHAYQTHIYLWSHP